MVLVVKKTSVAESLRSWLELAAGDYQSRPAPLFRPARIVLAKGSVRTRERRRLVEGICRAYPEAEVIEALEVPHNRIDSGNASALARHYWGKQTLVLGEHRSAVRFSCESGNACPNYWHISPYGFCPYGCQYCYLVGTPGVWFSPTVKVFLNLAEILGQVDQIARRLGRSTVFYLGKLQDALALDPLSGFARQMVPFFARHPYARLVMLTKSANVENLLDLDHKGHTILSWSLNPPEVACRLEPYTPDPLTRLAAMRQCAQRGYPLRAVLMPLVPIDGWQESYGRFIAELLGELPLARLTLGSICSYPQALLLMRLKLGAGDPISPRLPASSCRNSDGRIRFPRELREEMYRFLLNHIRRLRPGLEVSLCLEEPEMFTALDMAGAIGRCNCVG